MENVSYIEKFPAKERKFKLKKTFVGVSREPVVYRRSSRVYSYYGATWELAMVQENNDMGVYLGCYDNQKANGCSIETKLEFTLPRPSLPGESKYSRVINHIYTKENHEKGWTNDEFMEWAKVLEDMENNEIVVEVEVTIVKTTESIQHSRSFDKSQQEFSDVILTVDGEEFYVLKKFLASRSAYFKAMFYSNYTESQQDRINLPGIDARDFESFLKLINGDAEIDDSNVEGLLHFVDVYDAPGGLKSCEKFLLTESEMSRAKKLYLAKKYNMEKLAEVSISGMTVGEVEEALEDKETSGPIAIRLAKRALSLYN